jgi:hypothetical protein
MLLFLNTNEMSFSNVHVDTSLIVAPPSKMMFAVPLRLVPFHMTVLPVLTCTVLPSPNCMDEALLVNVPKITSCILLPWKPPTDLRDRSAFVSVIEAVDERVSMALMGALVGSEEAEKLVFPISCKRPCGRTTELPAALLRFDSKEHPSN